MRRSGKLQRTITMPFLIFYGVGTMIGGGFYALLGHISGEAGTTMPLALLVSGGLALLSACSFAELCSRYPVSAGEARYIEAAFGRTAPAVTVGWLVVLTGVVSAATLAVATVGFLHDLLPLLPVGVSIAVLVILLGGIAAWGIGESVTVITIITILEVGALVYAFSLNAGSLDALPRRWPELLPGPASGIGWLGVFGGAFLAFYAFIGFEDMVNVAEEVRDVRRTLPVALLVSILLTTTLYVAVAIVAVMAMPVERLAGSATPIAVLVSGGGSIAEATARAVSILTGINGALVQIIMAARVVYGLGKQQGAPNALARVSPATRTPLRATGLVTAIVLLLAVFFPLTTLASTTSGIILLVFALVNLALWRIKRSDPDPDGTGPRFPAALPLFGFIATLSVLGFKIWTVL